ARRVAARASGRRAAAPDRRPAAADARSVSEPARAARPDPPRRLPRGVDVAGDSRRSAGDRRTLEDDPGRRRSRPAGKRRCRGTPAAVPAEATAPPTPARPDGAAGTLEPSTCRRPGASSSDHSAPLRLAAWPITIVVFKLSSTDRRIVAPL